jgi:formamidopyrimidine-DNA glycosylase
MPELPEVETMRRGIAGIAGATVLRARKSRCRKRPLAMNVAWPQIARRLRQRRIESVGRHGKRLILHFDHGWSLVIEPRMTGLMLVDQPPTREHLRFELELEGSSCERVAYWDRRGLGQIFLLDEPGLQNYLSPRRIGPDAIRITADQLRDNLRDRRIAIKAGLLDQKAIAGVGNIYASEILHLAGIDPRKRCHRVTKTQWLRIHENVQRVMETAIRHEGSTLSDGTYRNALNDPGRYQSQHRVYDREHATCPTCQQGRIRRIVQAQRSTYFCGHCQKR